VLKRYSLVVFLLLLSGLLRAQTIVPGRGPNSSKRQPNSILLKFKVGNSFETLGRVSANALQNLTLGGSANIRSVFKAPTATSAIQSSRIAFGLDRIFLIPLKEGITPDQAVATLRSNSDFEYVEPNFIYHIESPSTADTTTPNDSLFSSQWGIRTSHVTEAWRATKGDPAIHIGFVDTGVDWFHPDLVHQFAINTKEDINHNGLFDPWPSTIKKLDARGDSVFGDLDGIDQDSNGYVDDVIGYDFVDQESLNYGDASQRDPIPQDENGHGTYVAGVIAAERNNHIGVSGVAPNCKMVALRAFDYSGNAEDDDIASAIVYAAENGVKILSLSFGDWVPSMLQRDAVRYANAKGLLVFASSGNSGGDARHYPSDFDDVVSVGATALFESNEIVWQFTTFSEGMDMLAPGDSIWTTNRGNGYTYVSGTSFSAPFAAATAGLLWSKRPSLSAIEVRSILASTTQDMGAAGYDHFAANGRVDAERAVNYPGSAAIKITSPRTNDGFHVGDTIIVQGHAVSTLFSGYTMSYALGINPDHPNSHNFNDQSVWQIITMSSGQISGGVLARWNTTGLVPGFYTLRLAVTSSDLRTTEERITIELSANPPKITALSIDTIFVNDGRGVLARVTSDDLTTAELWFRNLGGTAWSVKREDRYTKNHAILLSTAEAEKGVPLELRMIVRSASGDSASQSRIATVLDEGVPERGFSEKPFTLPPGSAVDSVLQTPAGDEVIMSVFPDGLHFGPVKVFAFDGTKKKFQMVDSIADAAVPRAIGNSRGDNLPELLLQASGEAVIYKQNATHSILGDVVYRSSDTNILSPGGFADVDGDGKQAIVGTTKVTDIQRQQYDLYEAIKWNGSKYDVIGTMPDTTPAAPTYRYNHYSDQRIVAADFLGDGKQEAVTIDDDADLIVYKRDQSSSTGFSPLFVDLNDGVSEGSMIAAGDFDGDGKPDIAFAYHRSFTLDTSGEYPPSYWTLKVFLNLGGGKFALNTTENFYYSKDPFFYHSSALAIRSVTGKKGDNLVLSVFPNLYLMEFDVPTHQLKPIWYYPVSLAPRGAVAFDFDKNGKREFGFVTGDSLRFFESDQSFTDQTLAPGAFDAIPRDTDRVDLHWGAVVGATKYNMLRADSGSSTYQLLNSSSSSHFTDSTVENGKEYTYSVTAVDASKLKPESENSFGVQILVHAKPRIASVQVVGGDQLRIVTTQLLQEKVVSGGVFVIDDSLPISTTKLAGDSTLILTPSYQIGPGNHTLRIRSFELRDRFSSPFDTAQRIPWTQPTIVNELRFYIVRWRFEGNTRIHVEFNERPSDSALDVRHYTLSPYGTLSRVYRDPANDSALFIDLAPGTIVAALGHPFVLCVTNIRDDRGIALEETEGNCAGVTLTEPDLTHLIVYPNPAKRTDGSLTFARLTASAEIAIYTADMHFLKRLSTIEKNGGVAWDLKDENGVALPSGVYLYYVTGKNDSGADVPPAASKFVIIGDR
jgi:subtilisin family serine protease